MQEQNAESTGEGEAGGKIRKRSSGVQGNNSQMATEGMKDNRGREGRT